MPDLTVHTIPGSPYARAVMATLEEKAAGWRIAPIVPGAHKRPPHLARHPFGRMPVLEHGDFTLYETQAILRYLDRVLPTPPLTPINPRQAARMDQVIAVNDWYLFSGVANVIVFHRIVSPRVLGGTPDETAIKAAMPQAKLVVAELARMLGDQPFMAGDALTLADLHVAPQLAMMAETPEWATLSAEHPHLVAWLARIENRPSFRATTWERVAKLAQAA